METSNEKIISLVHENAARLKLIEHYRKSYGDRVEEQVDLLLDLGGYIERFTTYLRSVLGNRMELLPRILVSK